MKPVPSLADTTTASRAFEHIRVAWVRNDAGERPQLRQDLEAFAMAFPTDGLAPLARIYLILSLMDPPASWAEAERRLRALTPPPLGSAHDLYVVADAKLRRYHHEPDAAFELLRPIVGKVVDGRARALLQEELTFDALEAREPYEAIAYMDAWLRGATEDDRAASEAKVAVALGAVPEAALHGSLEAMRASVKAGQSHGYGVAIERLVAERLGQRAVEHGDAVLARWLLDPEAGAPVFGEDLSARLAQLATSRRGIGSVAGRTVGLVLPTSSAPLRDEASDVLRGVLWALDIAKGGAEKEGAIRLVTRDDGGDPARLRASLEEVAGEGASVIITALDGEMAAQALAWGASSSLSVMVLATPTPPKDAVSATSDLGPWQFNIGEDWTAELGALANALSVAPSAPSSTTHIPPIAVLADTEALSDLVAAEVAHPSSWTPPLSCDAALSNAGESRFPIGAWDHAGVTRWLVAGSTGCADDLLQGLGGHPRRAFVGLSLEASETREHPAAGLRLVSAATGIVPLTSAKAGDPRVVDVHAMVARTGGPAGWWAAEGHDAAVLAGRALATLPANATSDPTEITRRRTAVQQGLLKATAPLWTSERDGFEGKRALPRTIRVIDLNR